MDRRRILLVAAVIVAALGAALVFVFVQSAENRAEESVEAVDVFVATQQIEAGETFADAQAAGKIDTKGIARAQLLAGVVDNGAALQDQVALTTIFPNEQLIASKFGGATDVQTASSLTVPEDQVGVSVLLTDPARVAGFVNPGSEVAVFYNGVVKANPDIPFTQIILPQATVLAVGSTTQVVTTTTTDEDGAQTTDQIPRTLLTLALDQAQTEKVLFSAANGELAFALLTEDGELEESRAIFLNDVVDLTGLNIDAQTGQGNN